ncbi:MAG: FHA domain-containing protein [Planctomycetes bacterium]|nr:FHA domain-containing protein [Planctomycetota bacterium]
MEPSETTILPLLHYTGIAAQCSEAEFAQRFPAPALLLAPFRRHEDDTRFETLPGDQRAGGLPLVAPVVKREGINMFRSMITLGRAPNNDIELNAQSVSKFHGYFLDGPDGGLVFADGNSSGGTFVDGARLPSGGRAPVRPGTRLRFGALDATLCSPAMLYEAALADPDDEPATKP